MADMDYDREISPWGAREGCRKSQREGGIKREGAREGSRHLEFNAVALALGGHDRVNGYCGLVGGTVLIFGYFKPNSRHTDARTHLPCRRHYKAGSCGAENKKKRKKKSTPIIKYNGAL